MQTLTRSTIRWNVVAALQEQSLKYAEGTEKQSVAEHAISLALSTERDDSNPAFLYRNAWRDSEKIIRRHRRSSPIQERLHPEDLDDTSWASSASYGRSNTEADSPEEQVSAFQIEQALRTEATSVDADGAVIFDCMIDGETVHTAARRTGASLRRVKTVRQAIRRRALELTAGRA